MVMTFSSLEQCSFLMKYKKLKAVLTTVSFDSGTVTDFTQSSTPVV